MSLGQWCTFLPEASLFAILHIFGIVCVDRHTLINIRNHCITRSCRCIMYSGWISSGPGAFPAFRVLRALVISAGVNAWQSWSSTEGLCLCSRSRSCTFLEKALSWFLNVPLFTNAVATSDARGALACLVDDFFRPVSLLMLIVDQASLLEWVMLMLSTVSFHLSVLVLSRWSIICLLFPGFPLEW